MRRILNASADIAICGETHYLKHWFGFQGFQREFASVGDITTEAGVERVVDYIYGIDGNSWRGRGFWGWVQRNTDRQEFLLKLLASDRSDHAVLDVVMDTYAGNRLVRGEKTPAHIHSVPTLLKWYPNSKIVHMFRDPRAIFVSEKSRQLKEHITLPYRLLWRVEPLLEIVLSFHIATTWLQIVRLHHRYLRSYPHNYYLCKYEDLVSDPETHLKKLCDFLDIEFTDQMLHLSYQNSSLVPRHQTQGIDSTAAERWRQHIHPATHRWLVFWVRRHLREFNYAP